MDYTSFQTKYRMMWRCLLVGARLSPSPPLFRAYNQRFKVSFETRGFSDHHVHFVLHLGSFHTLNPAFWISRSGPGAQSFTCRYPISRAWKKAITRPSHSYYQRRKLSRNFLHVWSPIAFHLWKRQRRGGRPDPEPRQGVASKGDIFSRMWRWCGPLVCCVYYRSVSRKRRWRDECSVKTP